MFLRNVFFDAPDEGGAAAPEPSFADARHEFLNNPPEILPSEDAPAPVEVDDEAELLEEATPPAGGATAPATGAPEPAGTPDPYAEFGGLDIVKQNAATARALGTESGLRLIIAQGLQALNYTPAQIRAALEGGPAVPGFVEETPPPSPFDIDDEDILTGADFKKFATTIAQQAAAEAAAAVRGELEPTVTSFEQQRVQVAGEAAQNSYVELIGPYPAEPEAQAEWSRQQVRIQQFATQYVDPNDWSPQGVRNAILRGHADSEAASEADFQARVAKKRAARAAQPTNVGGGAAPGSEPPKEPQTLAEATAAAKAAGLFK